MPWTGQTHPPLALVLWHPGSFLTFWSSTTRNVTKRPPAPTDTGSSHRTVRNQISPPHSSGTADIVAALGATIHDPADVHHRGTVHAHLAAASRWVACPVSTATNISCFSLGADLRAGSHADLQPPGTVALAKCSLCVHFRPSAPHRVFSTTGQAPVGSLQPRAIGNREASNGPRNRSHP
jgi:hypothetical protein